LPTSYDLAEGPPPKPATALYGDIIDMPQKGDMNSEDQPPTKRKRALTFRTFFGTDPKTGRQKKAHARTMALIKKPDLFDLQEVAQRKKLMLLQLLENQKFQVRMLPERSTGIRQQLGDGSAKVVHVTRSQAA